MKSYPEETRNVQPSYCKTTPSRAYCIDGKRSDTLQQENHVEDDSERKVRSDALSLRFLLNFLILSCEPRLYKRVCPSVGPSVGWSVGRSVRRSVLLLSRRAVTSRRTTYFGVKSGLLCWVIEGC